MKEPLWVTGLGLLTPLGAGVEDTWARLVRGDRGLRPVRLFDASAQRAHIVGEVDEVTLPGRSRSESAAWSRTSAMALAAAKEAMRASGLDVGTQRVGLVIGSTTGGMFETELLLARFAAGQLPPEAPVEMLSHPLTATGERLDERLGPFAKVSTLSSACSSGANAIVMAAAWLDDGDLDAVIAGGSDGLCRLTITGFNSLAALDPQPCRPFDRRRKGTNLGEGAGFMVIERAERARSRGARPIAELAGWALGAEAHHITNPAPDGARVAALIGRAMVRAGLSPDEIDYVNAHGTGTPLNDAMEAEALHKAFGREAERVPVSSSKGQFGHTLGAAGAIEAAITALVVQRRTLVPTAGLDEPDPAMALVHVPHVGRAVPRVRAAISNAFGFGGMDTVLIFKAIGPDQRAPSRAVASMSLQANVVQRTSACASPLVVTGAAVVGACGLLAGVECAGLPDMLSGSSEPLAVDAHLDAARARRMDLTSQLAAVAVEHAMNTSGVGAAVDETGMVLGNAFGNVDACAGFMRRAIERGPRAASPAEFPNLVPSSPAGHVSIYLGLRGPLFATAALGASGESAFAQAALLLAAGEAAQMVAVGVECRSALVESVIAPLFPHAEPRLVAARTDVAAALVLETQKSARARGARVLARVEQTLEWSGCRGARALGSLRRPHARRAELILARPHGNVDALLAGTGWCACSRAVCAPALGESDALGAVAVAVAVARIAAGRSDEALVLGLAQGRCFAILLAGQ
ncbi:MAG: beta-ketoacyl-[acyl-carrier-protein] synthase family protein [Myxococcota bacterium]|nr:beta-ketoacyl-[acyl-carrier-protein] synthase family protein [Myxococcota bacterium]